MTCYATCRGGLLVAALLQSLQDKLKHLEASVTTAVAAAEAGMSELRIQLEAERTEARRVKIEASSATKQYEQLVQRLQREADASMCQEAVMSAEQQAIPD